MQVALFIVYEPASPSRRPVQVARVIDSDLIQAVARGALAEAEGRVRVAAGDPVLMELEQSELDRLRRLLGLLLPQTLTLQVQ